VVTCKTSYEIVTMGKNENVANVLLFGKVLGRAENGRPCIKCCKWVEYIVQCGECELVWGYVL